MIQRNSKLLDADNFIFSVLDIAHLKLFGPCLWQGEDINSPEAIGATFAAFDEKTKSCIATLTLADVTGDTTEPDTSELDELDVPHLDAVIRGGVESQVDIVEWLGSQLVMMSGLRVLDTEYVERRGTSEWMSIVIRVTHQDKRFAAIGAFDRTWGGNLGAEVVGSLKTLKFVD